MILCQSTAEKPKIKIYRDEKGVPKGDGRCCYQRIESVQLALDLLNGSHFRPGFPVVVERVGVIAVYVCSAS